MLAQITRDARRMLAKSPAMLVGCSPMLADAHKIGSQKWLPTQIEIAGLALRSTRAFTPVNGTGFAQFGQKTISIRPHTADARGCCRRYPSICMRVPADARFLPAMLVRMLGCSRMLQTPRMLRGCESIRRRTLPLESDSLREQIELLRACDVRSVGP